jgi:hypothetical protein
VLCQGVGHRRAALDVLFDRQQQVLHARVFVAAADDVERLHQRHAGGHHGRQLAGEDGDVLTGDLALAAAEQRLRLLADLERIDALAAQVGAHHATLAARSSPLTRVPRRSTPSQAKT